MSLDVPTPQALPPQLSMIQGLGCGTAIVRLSMGTRHGFGLWLQPVTMDRRWTRETFAFVPGGAEPGLGQCRAVSQPGLGLFLTADAR